jgi:hypothetical protein
VNFTFAFTFEKEQAQKLLQV